MPGDDDSDDRSTGVDFGELDDALEDHSYPTTGGTLVDEYGDHEVTFADGSQTVSQLLEPVADEEFESPEDVRQMIYTMVDSGAVGRKGYSDRGGSTPEAGDDESGDESF